MRIYINPIDEFLGGPKWTDTVQLWGAADQLLLGVIYGLYAWGRYEERWGHIAAWLGMIGGGFIAIIYSRGHGSLAAKGAIIAVIMILAERGLNYLKHKGSIRSRLRAVIRLAWRLYQRPLLGGVDHLLFVFGLLLLVRDPWLLVKTITAFSVAHSVTLAAAALGWVPVQQAPVEAVIVLSILFLAGELARQRDGEAGVMQRYPWIVAFTFGLLHGFGFAGALREVGLPETDIPLALLTFNVGVEVGQLVFVGVVLLLLAGFRRLKLTLPGWADATPAYGIGTIAAFWTLQRVAPLF